jgi:hypothetical protein
MVQLWACLKGLVKALRMVYGSIVEQLEVRRSVGNGEAVRQPMFTPGCSGFELAWVRAVALLLVQDKSECSQALLCVESSIS